MKDRATWYDMIEAVMRHRGNMTAVELARGGYGLPPCAGDIAHKLVKMEKQGRVVRVAYRPSTWRIA